MATTRVSKALRFSIRIQGSVTSISLRKNITALWLTLSNNFDLDRLDEQGPSHLSETFSNLVYDFIYTCLNKWKEDNGKGFSDFVSEKMIADILESADFSHYKQILHHI